MKDADLLHKVYRAADDCSLIELRECAIRERRMRRDVYPGRVSAGKMRANEAAKEEKRMAAIVAVFEVLCQADPQRAGRLL
jgi:hypothetical protein